jgi:hypothetical protein
MGATVERTKTLIAMIIASSVAGAGIYVTLLFFPVWTGKLVQTVGLENFATTRGLLYFGIASVPMALGGLFGRLLGPSLPGGDLLSRQKRADEHRWWLDRSSPEEPGQEPSQS